MTRTNILIVIAKRPAPGQTKTRLIPPLLPQQAAALYECFLKDTLAIMKQVPAVQLEIAYSPENERSYFAGLAPDFGLHLQQGADLGTRLDHALQHYLKPGNCNVVIMDSDSPTLPAGCLVQAFTALNDGADVALGPCDDGGYYLIGLKQPAPRLLLEVHMSTPQVARETLALAAEEGLKANLLPTWYDIDDISTLRRLVQELEKKPQDVAAHTRAFLAAPEIINRIDTTHNA
ncbi:MAG: TIGR04282 family arsenosugar biosynthesis glycosyltransferase [Anaerolineaceae bacterium]|nr:TIGR04282 family arsenosugar biosynthesis glycosyltransferase [Anaerolineaceae bacterium]